MDLINVLSGRALFKYLYRNSARALLCFFFVCGGNINLIVVFSFYPNSVVDYLANEVAKTLSPVAQK